ncbi:MAG TPA: hypothetical protein VGD99_04460 [Anaerolineae bacterium]
MIHVKLTHDMIEEIAEQYGVSLDQAEEMLQNIAGMLVMNNAIEEMPAPAGGSRIVESPARLYLSWVTKAGERHKFVVEPSPDRPLKMEVWGKPGLQKLETVQIKGEPAYISQPDWDEVSITLQGARLKNRRPNWTSK